MKGVTVGGHLAQLRFQLRTAYVRYRLATLPSNSGLGQSVWLLYGLVRSLRPDVCVEIGSAQGWSTCHLAFALQENQAGKLYAIDPHMPTAWNDTDAVESLPTLRANLRRCRLEKHVEIIRMTSQQAAANWNRTIDLLFVDGDHSYEVVKRDWELFSPHLGRFAVAIFHDSTWGLQESCRPDMGVPRLLEELRQAQYPLVTLDRDYGLTMVQARRGGVPLLP